MFTAGSSHYIKDLSDLHDLKVWVKEQDVGTPFTVNFPKFSLVEDNGTLAGFKSFVFGKTLSGMPSPVAVTKQDETKIFYRYECVVTHFKAFALYKKEFIVHDAEELYDVEVWLFEEAMPGQEVIVHLPTEHVTHNTSLFKQVQQLIKDEGLAVISKQFFGDDIYSHIHCQVPSDKEEKPQPPKVNLLKKHFTSTPSINPELKTAADELAKNFHKWLVKQEEDMFLTSQGEAEKQFLSSIKGKKPDSKKPGDPILDDPELEQEFLEGFKSGLISKNPFGLKYMEQAQKESNKHFENFLLSGSSSSSLFTQTFNQAEHTDAMPTATLSQPTDQLGLFESTELPQKARALMQLADAYVPFDRLPMTVFNTVERYNSGRIPKGFETYFVRPCPFVPNHGALVAGYESHTVTKDALKERIETILSAFERKAPKAALIVMPYVEARYSAVVAPKHYAIVGRGHDGVTAGTDPLLTIPLQPESKSHHIKFIRTAGEKIDRVELEFVYGCTDSDYKPSTYLVQLRRAAEHVAVGAPPSPDAVRGFVPGGTQTVRATYVIEDIEDVNELEEIDRLIEKEGIAREELLVIQPSGSLLSHAAAHCRGKGIPFVIDSPQTWIGEHTISDAGGWVVEGEGDGSAYEPYAYADAFMAGADHMRRTWDHWGGKLSTFFHQHVSAPLDDPATTAYRAGLFVGWLAMAGFAACFGELRHAKAKTLWQDQPEERTLHLTRWKVFMQHIVEDEEESPYQRARDSVYNQLKALAPTWSDVAAAAEYVAEAFSEFRWTENFGGPKWGEAAALVARLARFLSCESEIMPDLYGQLIETANELENAVHNGGHLFNKFGAGKRWFDYGTEGFPLVEVPRAFDLAKLLDKIGARRPSRRAPARSWAACVEHASTLAVDLDEATKALGPHPEPEFEPDVEDDSHPQPTALALLVDYDPEPA